MTYSDKLRNPLWQRKRLEILDRDNFRCTNICCISKEKMLHVHHLDYFQNKEPWDIPNEYLITLCEDCHKEVTEERKIYERQLVSYFRLKFKDTFKQMCVAEAFKRIDNIDEIMFSLWENIDKQDKILEYLNSLNRIDINIYQNG